MHTALREARDTLVPDLAGRHGPLPPLLLGLTLVTGLVDAFSYLALGHVFIANMTGNVVFMAFSLAGAKGFSLIASLVSLLSFAAGALLSGRVGNLRTPVHRARLLLSTTAFQVVLVLAALLADELIDRPSAGWGRAVLIVLLGLAMGAQNATARRLAVPDLTTTVLTLTITGVAADSRVARGEGSKAGRRVLSVAAMFLGALAGAALVVGEHRPALSLLAAAVLLAGVTAALVPFRRSDLAWTR